jgi:lipopolysaccharide transport system ATP-binding protein
VTMDKLAIRVKGLGKKYRIGGNSAPYFTFRDAITSAVSAPVRWLKPGDREADPGDFWALRNVSFDINTGEAVGIIGRNGAGKSTLLKLLSRITEPTEGRAELYGRVGSLLEVGTGFHPELTGRENIYLSGSILGMKKPEIDSSFDAIVKFAETEKFLDTPLKHYSSGMQVRLGFAVAAHLDPEILIVDEVLAVGDAAFQKKCLGKMKDISQGGRTVLFVSHDMSAIARLCERAILLDGGNTVKDGPTDQVVRAYLQSGLGITSKREWPDINKAPGNDIARLLSVQVVAEDGRLSESHDIRKSIGIEMEYEVLKPGYVLVPNIHVKNDEGLKLFVTLDLDPRYLRSPRPAGRYTSRVWIPGNFLAEGTIIADIALSSFNPQFVHFDEHEAVAFHVVDSMEGDTARGDYGGPLSGVVRPILKWTTTYHQG